MHFSFYCMVLSYRLRRHPQSWDSDFWEGCCWLALVSERKWWHWFWQCEICNLGPTATHQHSLPGWRNDASRILPGATEKQGEGCLFLPQTCSFLCCPWLAVAEGPNSKGEMWFAGSQPQLHTAEYRKMSWYYEANSFITDTTHIHWPSGRVSGTRDAPLNQRLCPHTASSLVRPGRP